MIIAGHTTTGSRQLITAAGERIHTLTHKPDQIYVGLSTQEFTAKRVWVDEALTDADRLLFLRHIFSDQTYYSIDYEVIEQDSGRDWLHAYAMHQPLLQKNVTAIETNLHGLGRALSVLCELKPFTVFQCVMVCESTVLLSVHRNGGIYYFVEVSFHDDLQVVYAIRQAMESYYASQPLTVERCFYVNMSLKELSDVQRAIFFDAPLSCVDPQWANWLIPYGLACRGICHD